MVELHRRAEDAARGRDDAQLHVAPAADRHELGDHALVDRLRREDEAVDPERPASVGLQRGRQRRIRSNDGRVDVGEELELAPDRACELVAADDHDPLGRRHAAPREARDGAEDERRGERDHERADRGRGVERTERGQLQEERQAADRDDRPDQQVGQLVDGEVAERTVVAVVEPIELGGEDEAGQEEQRAEGGREAGAQERERRADRPDGAHVGERQDAPPERVACNPAARPLLDPVVGCLEACPAGRAPHARRGDRLDRAVARRTRLVC